MIPRKYLAALLSIAVVLVGALTTALAGGLSIVEAAQLVALVAGAVVTFLVPLLSGAWAGALKTGAAIVIALVTAALPFLVQGFITPEQIAIVVLAALNALAVEIGVNARVDAVRVAERTDDGTYLITDVAATRVLGA